MGHPRLNANWDLAKSMCLKGMPLKDIAKQTGIGYEPLRQRAHRYKWVQTATEASRAVTLAVTERMTDVATQHIDRILGYADGALTNLEKRGYDVAISDLQTLVNVADKLDQMKRRSLRLDEQHAKPSSLVQVNVNAGNGVTSWSNSTSTALAQVLFADSDAPDEHEQLSGTQAQVLEAQQLSEKPNEH